jgi:hypothetical protein
MIPNRPLTQNKNGSERIRSEPSSDLILSPFITLSGA